MRYDIGETRHLSRLESELEKLAFCGDATEAEISDLQATIEQSRIFLMSCEGCEGEGESTVRFDNGVSRWLCYDCAWNNHFGSKGVLLIRSYKEVALAYFMATGCHAI